MSDFRRVLASVLDSCSYDGVVYQEPRGTSIGFTDNLTHLSAMLDVENLMYSGIGGSTTQTNETEFELWPYFTYDTHRKVLASHPIRLYIKVDNGTATNISFVPNTTNPYLVKSNHSNVELVLPKKTSIIQLLNLISL